MDYAVLCRPRMLSVRDEALTGRNRYFSTENQREIFTSKLALWYPVGKDTGHFIDAVGSLVERQRRPLSRFLKPLSMTLSNLPRAVLRHPAARNILISRHKEDRPITPLLYTYACHVVCGRELRTAAIPNKAASISRPEESRFLISHFFHYFMSSL